MSSLERPAESMSAIVASTEVEGPSGMSVPKSTCRGPKNSRTQRTACGAPNSAELSQSAVELAQGLVDVAQRQRGRESGEAVRKPLYQFRHLVIGGAGKLRRDSRRPDLFKRRHGKHQDLCVIAVRLDLTPPRVQVGQHRIEGEDALAVVVEPARSHGFLELPLQPLEVRTRQDVRERIDLPHV